MTKEELIDFEHKVAILWENGQINAPVHLCGGNEDQLIEIFKEIRQHDYVFCGHRNHYHALLHGVSSDSLLDEIMGEQKGRCLGRARSMGYIDHSRNFYSSAIVGGLCSTAVGVAWALKRQDAQDLLSKDETAPPKRHVWCFIGDGALDGGHFWEAINYGESQDLPITFVIEDNDRATCTSIVQRMGLTPNGLRNIINGHPKVKHYFYNPRWPHVGTGKYVQF